MKKVGFKRLLILSILILVGFAVSLTSYILYTNQKDVFTKQILYSTQAYVDYKAAQIETIINEKVSGITKLAAHYQDNSIAGKPSDIIEKTQVIATSMNLDSAVIAFENGDAFWNQTSSSWPNHKLNVDVRTQSWYQAARQATNSHVTDPYKSDDNTYWITIAHNVKDGIVTSDMTLGFLNKLTESGKDIPGSIAMIFTQDTTVLSSTSDAIKAGDKASNNQSFGRISQEAIQGDHSVIEYNLDGVDKLLVTKRIHAGNQNWYFSVALNQSVAFAPLVDIRNKVILIATSSVIVSVLIAYILINYLFRPILRLRQTIFDLSRGEADLTQRLPVESDDELGQISSAVNEFIGNLHSMMTQVRDISSSLAVNSDRLKEQSRRNSQTVESHVLETEQVVTAIEEMNSTVEAMALDTTNTAELTHSANMVAEESKQYMQRAQLTVHALINEVEKAATDVESMSAEADNIQEILSVIGDIAEQTNLLALNAAIEAARAGDQGRGFAVVADEVRKLASRTKSSTKEIENALNSLLAGTQQVVKSMSTTKFRCQEAADGTGAVATSLDTMTTSIEDINNLSTQIATATEEQRSVTHELSRNMTAISEMVGEIDKGGKVTQTEAEELAIVNGQLIKIVNRFKL
ncbi:methyl-accepting chemotaxis protein [Vibrio porteresiae]|uniref:Methyl-accepting chemotaxis protein n=1 Tax=Vibrio porteresiae DSM 19223 TaxID=1123496 RepID=A0ABZ0QK86_9VIBR|nr:methyl-accepting chemotaxis protein [Vibrio porteresiae]WPC76215.1 methyl-accepting chemotaxis protein [Vibrio porteresiae DSM 19223]